MLQNSISKLIFLKCIEKNSGFRSNSYEDELIWAAAWLYKATGENSYLMKAEDMYASRQQTWTSWSFDWADKLPGAQLLLFELTGEQKYKSDVESFCDYAMGITKSPKGQTHLAQWGSNRYASNFAFICLGVRHL
jgi:endoglucanase